MSVNALEFVAEIRQVKTMVDKIFSVTINLPEYAAPQAAEIMQRVGDMIRIVVEFDTHA